MNPDARNAIVALEERLLADIASRLRAGCALSEWPAEARAALTLALAPASNPSAEWQARALRRHLLASEDVPTSLQDSAAATSRTDGPELAWAADRLRADLAGLVPLRALTRGRCGTNSVAARS